VKANYRIEGTTQFRVLTDDQIEAIYHAALEVLERTGCRVHDEEGRALLAQAGAHITDETLVRIPSAAVKDALGSCPQRVALCARDGSRTLLLEGNNFYYGTGSDCPFIYDEHSGQRREFTYADCERAALIFDALPNLDFFMSAGLVSDVPRMTYDRHQFMAMVTNTVKPTIVTTVDQAGLQDIYEMACLIQGGPDEYRLRPTMALYAEPSSPLQHSKDAVQKLLFAAEKGIPAVYTPCPIMGATAPATFAGALVQGLAESLTGVVMAQQKKRGAPLIIGGVISSMDMHDMTLTYGSPELHLASAAFTEIVKWLNLPMFSTGGTSDSKIVDQQAAIENAMSLLVASLSGAHLIHDISFLEGAMIASDEMIVMSDEIAGICRHIIRGIRVDEETLAVDAIDAVGPGGHFLQQEHTLNHYRSEFWFPTLMDRSRYDIWQQAGAATMVDRIKDKIKQITATHEVTPIPDDILNQMKQIVERADTAEA